MDQQNFINIKKKHFLTIYLLYWIPGFQFRLLFNFLKKVPYIHNNKYNYKIFYLAEICISYYDCVSKIK